MAFVLCSCDSACMGVLLHWMRLSLQESKSTEVAAQNGILYIRQPHPFFGRVSVASCGISQKGTGTCKR